MEGKNNRKRNCLGPELRNVQLLFYIILINRKQKLQQKRIECVSPMPSHAISIHLVRQIDVMPTRM